MFLPVNTDKNEVFADIIVDISHDALDRSFQYRVPSVLTDQVQPGSRVRVPFGPSDRVIEGYVISLKDRPDYDPEKIKDIKDIITEGISVESQLIEVADYLRRQYGSTMIAALKTVLPVKRRIRQKTTTDIQLGLASDEAERLAEEWKRKHYTARSRLLRCLMEKGMLDSREAVRDCGVSMKDLKKLRDQGILLLTSRVSWRRALAETADSASDQDPAAVRQMSSWKNASLNPQQQQIADEFRSDYDSGIRRTYLLFGITGSGKTEVYLSLIETVLRAGRQAVVLIPEISLTYQTVSRFSKRFGDLIAVIHSRMSAGERSDEVERIRTGEARVVIGARSALFAPVSDLGLIIIDEEHDGAYKSDSSPKYHARETAVFRAELAGASVVLGSATPSVESFFRARKGEYRLWTLPKRAGSGRLPEIRVVDLKEEFASGNRSIFSRTLRELIEDRLKKKEQIMLFLNRRGYAGFVSCRSCGQVMKCPHCDVSLTYHKNGTLQCHYCGYEIGYERKCPTCGRPYMAAFGLGTEKVEAAVHKEFPGARILRMDADTTRRKHAHEKLLRAFSRRDADILLGTQMIVKGHDYENVTLVGILAADLSLGGADFRSGERTYQLLCQAAGRAGRGSKPGQVVIQTYHPDHYAITAVRDQSYETFYEQEYAYRELMHYPPCSHLLVILIMSRGEEQAIRASRHIVEALHKERSPYPDAPVILNPGKASVSKIKDIYRQVIFIKHENEKMIKKIPVQVEEMIQDEPLFAGVTVQFDYDPMNRY